MKPTRYDESFKAEAAQLALSSETSYVQSARDLGVNYATLTHWIYQAMKHPKPEPISSKCPARQDYQALERKNRALQKEWELRKKEIEFLKKASAYIASLKQ